MALYIALCAAMVHISPAMIGSLRTRVRRRGRAARALGLLLCLAGSASAQIVNVQPLIMDPRRNGLAVVADAALDLRTGNTRLVLLSGSLLVRYRHERQLVFVLARQEYGVQDGERFLSKDFEHLRYQLRLTDVLELESFVQHDRDEFRRLAWRVVSGMGPRFTLLANEAIDLALGVAYMQELERLDNASYPDAGEQDLAHRLSSYVALSLRLNDKLRLGQTVYVQPRFDRPNDFRLLNESELLVSLSTIVALKATLSIGYDAEPADGRRALDTITKTGLQLRLK
jgi:hypothetical protein